MSTHYGTIGYLAPEISASECPIEISTAVDMWSFGVLLYEMAVGYNPQRVYKLSSRSGVNFDLFSYQRDWKDKDPLLKDLISKLLIVDPLQRLTA